MSRSRRASSGKVAARKLYVTLRAFKVRDAADFEKAFGAIRQSRVGGLLVLVGGLTVLHQAQIVDFAKQNRLPLISESTLWSDGALMTYGPNPVHMVRRAAIYVDRILKGARAGDLPIEQPTQFELVVNLKIAKALGLRLPKSLLLRADKLIE